MIPKPIAIAIVCVVTFVWVANFLAQFLVPGYAVDGYLHTVFLIIVGGALGFSRKGNGSDKGGPPTGPEGVPPGGPDDQPEPPPPRESGAHRAPFGLLPRAAI